MSELLDTEPNTKEPMADIDMQLAHNGSHPNAQEQNSGAANKRDVGQENHNPEDTLRTYLKQIGRTALLKAEEEVELAKRIEAGVYAQRLLLDTEAQTKDELAKGFNKREALSRVEKRDLAMVARDGDLAKNHLWEANLRLVVSIAKRYSGKGLPTTDLIQEGNIGLHRAVQKFDYAKGFKFSTYATWWIKQAITRSLHEQARTIRYPLHFSEMALKISNEKQKIEDFGTELSPEELASKLGIDVEKLLDMEETIRLTDSTASLDTLVGEGGGATLGDFVRDGIDESAEQRAIFNEVQREIGKVLAEFPERDQDIISARFGLGKYGGTHQSLDCIGERHNLSRERVRQIEREVKGKILLKAKHLRDYIQ